MLGAVSEAWGEEEEVMVESLPGIIRWSSFLDALNDQLAL